MGESYPSINDRIKVMNKNGFSAIWGIVLVLAIMLGGIVWYLYVKNSQTGSNIIFQPDQSMTATSADPTAPSTFIPPTTTSASASQTGTQPDCSFSANPFATIYPQKTQLTWNCRNVNKCFVISDQGEKFSNQNQSGTISVTPMPSSTNYSLQCSAINGTTFLIHVNVRAVIPGTTNGQP
jgi:cytoskeletal protein RodZ